MRWHEWHEAKDKDLNKMEDKMTGDFKTRVSALITNHPILRSDVEQDLRTWSTHFYNEIEVTETYTWQAGCVGEFL